MATNRYRSARSLLTGRENRLRQGRGFHRGRLRLRPRGRLSLRRWSRNRNRREQRRDEKGKGHSDVRSGEDGPRD
jgi:hypothetical protein